MVGADGRVRVVDFGLARAVEAVTTTITTGTRSPAQGAGLLDSDLTIAGTVLGTPGYMAPEQFRAREADVRTDIFSFCVALYEALYGQRPFDGGSYDEIAASVTAGRLAAPPEGARVPAWLRRVLARGLARDPDDRWPSLDALLAALADDPIARRRRRIKRSIAGLALLALVIGAPLCFQTMFDRWRADARERSAADRWELVSARIDVLARSGREREAEAAFAAYTAAPEHQGTRALSRAWLERGRQRYRAGALEQATHAFASAYTEAPTPALERETLLAMGGLFRERGDFDALAPLVAMLEEPASESRAEVDPELDTLRLDDALHAHDFARARALVDRLGDDAAPRHAGLRPLLDRLTRATAVAAMDGTVEFIDLDGDGQGEYVGLPFTFEALRVLRVDGTARAEHPLPRGVHHAILVRGAPYMLLQTGTETRLYRFDLEALRERWRGVMAPNVAAAVVGDVDRDGAYELYVGLKDVGRTLLRLRLPADDDAPIEPPEELVAATASARSDVAALRIADLDGDGHDALIASFGAWRTYDVRVLRPRGDALEITARRETGNVNALCVLRRPDGAPRIAVAKDDLWANRRVFPEPPHTGPSAGVYLLDPEGPSLAVASYTPITLSPRAAPQLRLHKLECADLDGDGRDELLVSAAPRSVHDDLASTVLLRSGVGDELHALRLEGLRNPVIAEIDGAAPYELFVQTGEQSWVLGAGAQQLAPAPRRALTAAATPAGLDDPALRERWRRAERLAALGLFEVAAPVMLDLAGIVGVPELASRFTARAAEYVARAGDERRAIELLARIQEPWSAVRRASDEIAALLLRLGELRAAAIRWRELGGPPPEARAIVPFRGDELAALADPSRVHAIEFARASELPWTVVDTAAVVRDPARRTLRVRSGDAAPAALSLPLAWDGGPLVVTVELTIEHIEYGGSIGVGLRDASGRWPLSARVATVGGSGVFERRWFCADHWVRIDPDVPAERAEHVTITLAYSPATSGRRCFIASEDDTHGRLAEPLALAGPLFLDIGALAGSGAVPEPTVVDATVSRVELIGLSPGDADPRSPDERARALLIEGRVDEARALLDTPTLRDRALLAAAFAERGRWSDAHALLTPLARLDDEALLELAPVLAARARELSPLLEPLLAARYLALEQRAFTVPTLMHYHERFAQELILRSFAGLDRGDPLDPEVAFTLLLARGRARRQLGDLAGARADLQRALGSDARGDVSSAAAELAQLLLHHGEPDAARAVLNDALARATDRRDAEFTLERVAALRPLLSAP